MKFAKFVLSGVAATGLMAVLTAASLGPASAQPRVIPMVHTQNAGDLEEVGYRERDRYGYRRYGDYRPRYRPYYGYQLDLETYSVWRNKRPSWFDYPPYQQPLAP